MPCLLIHLFPSLIIVAILGCGGGEAGKDGTWDVGGVAAPAGPFLRWFVIDLTTPVRTFVTRLDFLIAHLSFGFRTAQYRFDEFLMYTRGFPANVCAEKRVLVNPGMPGDAGAAAAVGAAAVARVNDRILEPPGPSTYSPPRGPRNMVRPFEFFSPVFIY